MRKQHVVVLPEPERARLHTLIGQGTAPARVLTHARILLKANQGEAGVEATVHNTRQLGCGRTIERFPQIATRLAGMTDRFCTTLDCVTTGFLPDGTLDQLPLPPASAAPASAASTATSPGCGPRWQRSWRFRPHPAASPSPTWPPRSSR